MARFGLFVAIGILLAPVATYADVVFVDNTFDLSNYSDTPTFASGEIMTFSQCTSCGNPGSALQIIRITDLSPPIPTRVDMGIINNSFVYDPRSQGPISSIFASADENFTWGFTIVGGNFTAAFEPLIEQDGKFYVGLISSANLAPGTPPGTTGYRTISQSRLVASDFQEFDFSRGISVPGNPDFSGDPMVFGLAKIGRQFDPVPNGRLEYEYDNFVIDISTVPEPSTLLLMSTFTIALAVIGKFGSLIR